MKSWHLAILSPQRETKKQHLGVNWGFLSVPCDLLGTPQTGNVGPCILGLAWGCSPRRRAWSLGSDSRQDWRKCAPCWIITEPQFSPRRPVRCDSESLSQPSDTAKIITKHNETGCLSFGTLNLITLHNFWFGTLALIFQTHQCLLVQTRDSNKHLIQNDICRPVWVNVIRSKSFAKNT